MAVEHVVVGTGGVGSRFLNKNWPNEDGLTAGTTTQTDHQERLIPEQSFISQREKLLID